MPDKSNGKETGEATPPKSCTECAHWAGVKKKLRVTNVLEKVITKMEANLETTDFKASLTDYLKLVQIEKEVGGEEEPKEIKVTWVQPDAPNAAT